MSLPKSERMQVPIQVDNVTEHAKIRNMRLADNVKNMSMIRNQTLMDLETKNVKDKFNAESMHNKINYVRMHKQEWLPFNMVRFNSRGRTGCFVFEDEKSLIDWCFFKKNIGKPNNIFFKNWIELLEWLVK